MDPLGAIKDKIEEIKHDVGVKVETAILERNVAVALSRLKDLHPEDDRYANAQNALG